MKSIVKGLVLFICAAAAIGLLVILKKTSVKVQIPRKESSKEFLEFKKLRLAGFKNGKKQWEIKAKKTWVSSDQRYTKFEDIREGVFYEDGKERIYFSATEAYYDSIVKTLKIEGNIVARSNDGTELRVEQLLWDGVKEKLTSPGKVTLRFKKGEFVGSRLVADTRLEQVDMTGGVAGTLLVEGKKIKDVVQQ